MILRSYKGAQKSVRKQQMKSHFLIASVKKISNEFPILKEAKREVLEESSIEITDIKPVSFDEDYEPNKCGIKTHYVFLVFKAKYKSGELNPKSDISELKWIDKRVISSIELNRPTIKLFKKVKLI